MCIDEGGELGHDLGPVAQGEPCFETSFLREQTKLLEPDTSGSHERHDREAGERLAPPKRESLFKEGERAFWIADGKSCATFGDLTLESCCVDLFCLCMEEVPRPAGEDPVLTENLTETMDIDVERCLRPRRRIVWPEAVDRRLAGNGGVRIEQQTGEQEPLLGCAQPDGATVEVCLE